MAINISFGTPSVVLPNDPGDSAQQVEATSTAHQTGALDTTAYRQQLSTIAAQFPTCLSVWAALGELLLPEDVIVAYAFFRTGYHRGLDRARSAGWNGSQQLRWEHPNNRGFLRCLYGLLQAATRIGETSEQQRIQGFLLDLDPSNPFQLDNT